MCTRYYAYYSGNAAHPGEPPYQSKGGTCKANKIGQWGWGGGGGGAVFHPNQQAAGVTVFICKGGTLPWSNADPPLYTKKSFGPDISNCYGEVCRIEVCGESGNDFFINGLDISGEMKITVVTGPNAGMVLDYPKIYCGDANGPGVGGAMTSEKVWIGNLYRQDVCAGHKEISHAMQAEWDTVNDQWIGPAYEIEGGVGSVCGNGIIELGEQCDDDDTINGDGCSSSCTVESGYTCVGEPSVCSPVAGPVCGDETCDPGEDCSNCPGDCGACPAGDCTDGVDCLCDILSTDPNIIFCDDFESTGPMVAQGRYFEHH
jgi:cysteine-rich repeat protein